jgi:hypothetical protein
MKGHLLRGEERVTVALRDHDQSVDVEVLSVSRPASTMFSRALWPLVGKKQNSFFEMQMGFLRGIAGQNEEGEEQKRLSSFPLRLGGENNQLEYDF